MSSKTEQQKKKKCKNIFKYFVYDFIKITGAISVIVWLRLKTFYTSKKAKKKIKGAALIYANHNSFKDPIILHNQLWYRRLYMVATKELFSSKLARWFFKQVLCIEIDKENVGVNSFKEIINTLNNKKLVAIFPEGHINENKEKLDFFKSGIVLMAMQAKVPIVPIYIINREKWWQRQKIVVGEPINLPEGKLNLVQINEFSALLRHKEMELIEFYNNRRKK